MSEHIPTLSVESDEGPRERLALRGEDPLSDAELVAILLGTGSTRDPVLTMALNLLRDLGGLRALARASHGELTAFSGVGPAKAARLRAAVELARRIARAPSPERPQFGTAADVFDFVHLDLRDLRHEVFDVLILDTRHRLMRKHRVSVGTLNGSLVHPREVFRPAIINGAAAIILVHNHPSGDPTPSREDIDITERLVESGTILGIHVLDHVVVGDGRYASLADQCVRPTSAKDQTRNRGSGGSP